MKILIASDIHGSARYCRELVDLYHASGAERMLLLGDLLYHGPRNDLPEEYAPKEVIRMLSDLRDEIFAVRGNCEAEVDQMVLPFPVMADYCILPVCAGTRILYATHGHVYHEGNRPPMKKWDILLHGHTHVWKAEKRDGFYLLNPGSVSLPKEGNSRTCAFLEEDIFTVTDLSGKELCSIDLTQE